MNAIILALAMTPAAMGGLDKPGGAPLVSEKPIPRIEVWNRLDAGSPDTAWKRGFLNAQARNRFPGS